MVFAPPVAAVVLGVRAAQSGSELGTHASAVAAASTAFVIMFWYRANYPHNGESGAMPLTLAAITAVLVATAIEGGWTSTQRETHSHEHDPALICAFQPLRCNSRRPVLSGSHSRLAEVVS